jgi:Ca2+-binding RTX toxin-like protein
MSLLTVGPNSAYRSIGRAMRDAGPTDTIQLEPGYSNETAWVTHNGMTIDGDSSSVGIVLRLGSGISSVALTGTAPIELFDNATDGNSIAGNDGDNLIHVSGGADAVSGGLGHDRLIVDYRLAAGAVTGDSSSNVTEAGAGGRLVTINGGFEDFTILTGSGADTITTGAGDDIIKTGEGAGTITAGQGANLIVSGSGADTITALDGGNVVDAGDGANTITTGSGVDLITTGRGMDTVVSGAGNDIITILGGADGVDAGAGVDRLVIDYSAAVTAVSGGVQNGNAAAGYGGHIADLSAATLDFVAVEQFWITTGSGNDKITTGAGNDRIDTGAGSDALYGGSGRDALNGGEGDDRLVGGRQQDMLHGGAGKDSFVFNTVRDSGAGSAARDVVGDFSHAEHDRIVLANVDADTTQVGNQVFHLLAGSAFTGQAGEMVRGDDGAGNTLVSGDVDGDSVADFQITGLVALVASDFAL